MKTINHKIDTTKIQSLFLGKRNQYFLIDFKVSNQIKYLIFYCCEGMIYDRNRLRLSDDLR